MKPLFREIYREARVLLNDSLFHEIDLCASWSAQAEFDSLADQMIGLVDRIHQDLYIQ